MQTKRPLRRWRSFKVTDFGTNRKPICDFLLMINNNLPSILAPFPSYGWVLVKFSLSTWECLTLTPPLGVIPCEYPVTFTSPETRRIVLPNAENCRIVSSFFWAQLYRNVTEGQTERQNPSSYALRAMRTRCMVRMTGWQMHGCIVNNPLIKIFSVPHFQSTPRK